MPGIFISYSRANLQVVQALAEDLAAAGNAVWYDRELTGGQRWWENILARIRESDIFAFALTPESLQSAACTKELVYACELNREILPILLSDHVDVHLLPDPLDPIHVLDYRRQDKHALFSLIRAVNGLRSEIPLPDPLPVPPRQPVSDLTSIGQRIDDPEALDLGAQIALVFELKEQLRKGRSVPGVLALFNRLRQRPDLLARVGDEIDATLGSIAGAVPATPALHQQSSAGAAETESPLARAEGTAGELKLVAAEIEILLQRVWKGEKWEVKIDASSSIHIVRESSSGTATIHAKCSFLDADDAAELEELGWSISKIGLRELADGGYLLAAFMDTGSLMLLLRHFKDFPRHVASREWPVRKAETVLAAIAQELEGALREIGAGDRLIVKKG